MEFSRQEYWSGVPFPSPKSEAPPKISADSLMVYSLKINLVFNPAFVHIFIVFILT